MPAILHDALPDAARPDAPLPGVSPFEPHGWLLVDEVFAAQMALREGLIAECREEVIGLLPEGGAAAEELLEEVLAHLAEADGYAVGRDVVTRPDGASVPIDRADPLATLGRLVQEDLCILQKEGAEHVLTGGVLCFPSSWRLGDKLGRPLVEIHMPVPEYDADIARRVQRLFDGVRVGRPLERHNFLRYADADLHQTGPKPPLAEGLAPYLRSERQCILRLPKTRAMIFSIHSWVVRNPDA